MCDPQSIVHHRPTGVQLAALSDWQHRCIPIGAFFYFFFLVLFLTAILFTPPSLLPIDQCDKVRNKRKVIFQLLEELWWCRRETEEEQKPLREMQVSAARGSFRRPPKVARIIRSFPSLETHTHTHTIHTICQREIFLFETRATFVFLFFFLFKKKKCLLFSSFAFWKKK